MTADAKTGQWHETAAGLLYVVGDSVQFEDDLAHWKQGFSRLLEISDEQCRKLVVTVVAVALEIYGRPFCDLREPEKLSALKEGVGRHFVLPERTAGDEALISAHSRSWGASFDGSPADTIYAHSISGNQQRMVVGAGACQFGWQITTADHHPVPAASVEYDRSYYDLPRLAHCGMRDYIRDDHWRIEKARRLMKTVIEGAGSRSTRWLKNPERVRALDVGSATGYFRQAISEMGFQHYGIDLSGDAIRICKETFGFDTWQASVFELPAVASFLAGSCDIITLWDTIEHFDEPLAVAKLLREFLSADGILVVRTPSLTAFEAEILRDMYYSFKLDHVRYFSPRSLTALMEMAGLAPVYMETTSHLFKGFLGATCLYRMGRALKGADIVALYSK